MPINLKGFVQGRSRKPDSDRIPKTTTKLWSNEIRPSGLESSEERKEFERPKQLWAKPNVMHFGGYEINKKQSQTLRVVNKSLDTVRLIVLNPTTPFFRLNWKKDKPGFLAPGMALEVVVDFAPTEWRYYYDAIRINCGQEKILVPIHAYPVMNEVVFPKLFDVGKASLGAVKECVIPLKCTAPIAFEFEISVTKEHYDFKIYPLNGIVPANGEFPLKIAYSPTKLSTAEFKIVLNIAQFGYKPFETTIIGSGVTDFVSTAGNGDIQPSAFGRTNKRPATSSKSLKAKHASGAGAVDDAGAELASKINRSRSKKAAKKRSYLEQKSEYFLEKGGIKVPHSLQKGHHLINFVLTQEEGRLKPHDLRQAIKNQNRLQKEQMTALDTATAANVDAIDAIQKTKKNTSHGTPTAKFRGVGSGPSLSHTTMVEEAESMGKESQSKRVREAMFTREMNDISTEEKQRQFKNAVVLGEPLMTADQINQVKNARNSREIALQIQSREVDRQRIETESLGPYQDPPKLCPVPLEEAKTVSVTIKPKFNEYDNDTWDMRNRIVRKFVSCVTKYIVRRRVAERISALKMRLGASAGFDTITPEDVAALIEQDNKNTSSIAGNDTQSNTAKTYATDKNTIEDDEAMIELRQRPVEIVRDLFYERFSQFDKDSATAMHPMNPSKMPFFHNVEYSSLIVPKEYELAGYTEEPLPAFQSWIPRENDRKLLQGAAEEISFQRFKHLEELDQSDQAKMARVQHERYIAADEREKALIAFKKYDSDGSGSIDNNEMADILKELGLELEKNDPIIQNVMDSTDIDDDGFVSFDEFLVFYRKCLSVYAEAAAKSGDVTKRLDIMYLQSRTQPCAPPVQLTRRLRLNPMYHRLPNSNQLEFHRTYNLRPQPISKSIARPLANEQAHLLNNAEQGFLLRKFHPERSHFEILPSFYQSPTECARSNEFNADIDLIPWKAKRTPWRLTTPAGLTVEVDSTSIAPIPDNTILRPELRVPKDREIEEEYSIGRKQAAPTWAGVKPENFLLSGPQSDDDLSDSDTDSEDECGLPLRPKHDILLTPAVARHFFENVEFDTLYANELDNAKSHLEKKFKKLTKHSEEEDSNSVHQLSVAEQSILTDLQTQLSTLEEEIKQFGDERIQASEKDADAIDAQDASTKHSLFCQPRTIGSVYGRELCTETDGAAPTIDEQNMSSKLRDSRHADISEEDSLGVNKETKNSDAGSLVKRFETDEERDERLANEHMEKIASLERNTHRLLRWGNRGPGHKLAMHKRDAALLQIAEEIDQKKTKKFTQLVDEVAKLTQNAMEPGLHIEM